MYSPTDRMLLISIANAQDRHQYQCEQEVISQFSELINENQTVRAMASTKGSNLCQLRANVAVDADHINVIH